MRYVWLDSGLATKVFVDVYGCSANQADAEIASGLLNEAGLILVGDEAEADVSVILTCIVKSPTEQKMVKRLQGMAASGRKFVVAGCMPKALRNRLDEIAPDASIVGPDDISAIPRAVSDSMNGLRGVYLDGSSPGRTCLPRVRRSSIIHIAPIASGCLGNCSYCIVKLARGVLRSFPMKEIVSDANVAIQYGCKEIWVTAEDTAAYNDNGCTLPDLVNMLSSIEGEFRIRVGMMTPNSAMPIIEELMQSYLNQKVFRFLHIPIQSGSNEILKKMRRKYNFSDFMEVVEKFRKGVPQLSISTDMICGFPGETDEQFNESLALVNQLRPDVLNISRFWPRPGTEAANLVDQLPGWKTKDRSRKLDELWKNVSHDVNRRWVGWEGEVLLDEEGHSEAKIGRNQSYKAIAIRTDSQLGQFVKVRITGSAKGYLLGEKII